MFDNQIRVHTARYPVETKTHIRSVSTRNHPGDNRTQTIALLCITIA